MAIYFSIGSDGFYHSEACIKIPDDAIEITEEQYDHFLYNMNMENKKLVFEDGKLILVPREKIIPWWLIRKRRDSLLSKSDYTQMPDWPGDKPSWTKYRQELRDIPQKFSDPNQVVWPKAPNA